jgi:hypothetical protein
MKMHQLALALVLAVTGTAFAATTTTTVTRDTPHGTVTKKIVKVSNHHRPRVRHVVVVRKPVHRHYAVNHHRNQVVHRKVIIDRQG